MRLGGGGCLNGSGRWQEGGVGGPQIRITVNGTVPGIHTECHGTGHHHMGGGGGGGVGALVAAAAVRRGANHRGGGGLQAGQPILLPDLPRPDNAARQAAAAAVRQEGHWQGLCVVLVARLVMLLLLLLLLHHQLVLVVVLEDGGAAIRFRRAGGQVLGRGAVVGAVVPVGHISPRNVHLQVAVVGGPVAGFQLAADSPVLGDLVLADDVGGGQLGALLAPDVDHDEDGQDEEQGHHRDASNNGHQKGDALWKNGEKIGGNGGY